MTGNMTELETITEVSLAAGDQISHDDVTARIPEEWAGMIEGAADKLRVFRNFAIVNTDLLNHPGDTIKIPKRVTMDMNTYAPTVLNELSAITPSALPVYQTVEITPVEVGMGGKISRKAIEEVFVSLINDVIERMAESVAQVEDLNAVAALVATTADQEITYVEANVGSHVYVSGKWTAAVAGDLTGNEWQGVQANLTATADANDVLDLGVITEAQDVLMQEQGFTADTLIVHPRQIAALKRSPQFMDASKFGDNHVIKTGMVGNFFGLNVYVSRNVPTLKCDVDGLTRGYQAIMLDSRHAFALAIKRNAEIEPEYKPAERMHYFYITSVYKFKRLNDGAVIVINTV